LAEVTGQPLIRLRRLMWLSVLAGCAALATAVTHPAGAVPWIALAVAGLNGLTAALLERRSSAPASPFPDGRERHDQLAAVRQLIESYGEDSIAPFIARPDKAYAFTAGAVLAYGVFGRTAVVSGDPVGRDGAAAAVLEAFMETARCRGWGVVLYGARRDRLEVYHRLGFRSVCVGEEAVKRPADFSLEGRRVRKLRQSVHRIQRRGWQIEVYSGAEIEPETEAEINGLEARWRAEQPRLLGFAMSMGRFEAGVGPADLYLLARSPDGSLAATMRFIGHRGKLSLDTMRRVRRAPRGVVRRRMLKLGLALLGRHFQMERLVRFNEKFSPEWRPRYLVYPTRRSLPRAVYRVLQAEGYLASRHRVPEPSASGGPPRPPRALLSGCVDASRR
jgi:lysyl-tRNA synthetase class 2